VQVWAPAAVATAALPAGATLQATAFTPGQTDWAAAPTLPYADGQALAGRVLSRPLAAGQALRMADLQPRRWFALGETVQVQLRGAGFAIDTQAVALTAGIEGQAARARTEAGRVLLGRPVAERRMELLW
jgi:flagella basal body P-ring formation protein FlgA